MLNVLSVTFISTRCNKNFSHLSCSVHHCEHCITTGYINIGIPYHTPLTSVTDLTKICFPYLKELQYYVCCVAKRVQLQSSKGWGGGKWKYLSFWFQSLIKW